MKIDKKYSELFGVPVLKLLAAVAVTIFLIFSVSVRLNSSIKDIQIKLSSIDEIKTLVKEDDVKKILKEELGFDIGLAEFTNLDLFKLERVLESDARIDNAQLFLDKHNRLYIEIDQRKPIVRIDVKSGKDYYLDNKGMRIPIVETFRVPVVTGFVDAYSTEYKADPLNNLNDILALSVRMNNDDFLSALIEQIYVDENNEITIIPKVGRDKILIGEINDLDEKIYKLKVYYERGIKNIGINKFDELDLKYHGQIIGRDTET